MPLRIEIGRATWSRTRSSSRAATSRARKARRSACSVDGMVAGDQGHAGDDPGGHACSARPTFREANTRTASSYDEFKQILEGEGGFIRVHWAGTGEDEDRIKEETKATIRCFPFDKPEGEGRLLLHRQAHGPRRDLRPHAVLEADGLSYSPVVPSRRSRRSRTFLLPCPSMLKCARFTMHTARSHWPPAWPEITDPLVLDAMASVPRHLFVPPDFGTRHTRMRRCRSASARRSRSRISWR